MDFDPAKNATNIAKHGLSFARAEAVFDAPVRTIEDRGADYGEKRFNTLGLLAGTVVHFTWTESEDGTTRAISLRPATPAEKRAYVHFVQGR